MSGENKLDSHAIREISETLQRWHGDGDRGMQCVIFYRGKVVVDCALGYDPIGQKAISRHSLFCILSASKILATMVMLYLHDQGLFEWTDPISKTWPSFGRHGKDTATIEHLMSHRIGIPHLTAPWRSWADYEAMARVIEESEPLWAPGTRYGYHGGVFGAIVNELVKRWTGRITGDVLETAITGPSGYSRCYLGIPHANLPDVAKLLFLEPVEPSRDEEFSNEFPPWGKSLYYNNDEVLQSCQPSGGAVTTAYDLAGLMNILAFEGTFLGKTYWSQATQREACIARNSLDEQPAYPSPRACWGLGAIVAPSSPFFGTVPPSARTMGHAGASGAVAFADPVHQLAVAFTINGIAGKRMYYRFQTLGDLIQNAIKS